jgi:DNA-binding beta-propeller fold protein YncE
MTANETIATFAGGSGIGFADGQGSAAKFDHPQGVAFGPNGNLYVADNGNNRIRMITPAGLVSTVAGTGPNGADDGDALKLATFNYPYDLAFDPAGNMYVSETAGQKVRKITPAGIVSTVAFFSTAALSIDTDAAGNVYVLTNNEIRKISPAGGWSVIATGNVYRGLAIEQSTGIIYVSLGGAIIQKILPDGTTTTLAGTLNQYGNVNGTGADARFSSPIVLKLDSTGALIVASAGTDDLTLRMIK